MSEQDLAEKGAIGYIKKVHLYWGMTLIIIQFVGFVGLGFTWKNNIERDIKERPTIEHTHQLIKSDTENFNEKFNEIKEMLREMRADIRNKQEIRK